MIKLLKKQIELLRREKGWSQAELAHRLHISPSTVGMYEQGRREPSIDTLVALSQEFGVTIDYLITGDLRTITNSEVSCPAEYTVETFTMLKNLSREELIVLLAANLITQ